jgi:hypothetical protein
MKIIKNEALIKRNGKIGQWTSLAGVVVLAGGMFITLRRPDLFNYALISLLLGFVLTQVSIYLGNRFGRSPRPDESLDAGLKGLPGDYTLYHFTAPVAHLLVGPAGIWVLKPYRQAGKVTYQKNRWKMAGGGFMQSYMRLFGQESIGRPEGEAESEIRSVHKELARTLDEETIPPINAMLVFTNPDVEVESADSPLPALRVKNIKDYFRQKAKEDPLSTEAIQKVKSALE